LDRQRPERTNGDRAHRLPAALASARRRAFRRPLGVRLSDAIGPSAGRDRDEQDEGLGPVSSTVGRGIGQGDGASVVDDHLDPHARRREADGIGFGAIDLFQRNSSAATGLAEIVASAEAPKSSFSIHFPAGKPELGVHAVREASRLMVALFESVASTAKDAASAVTDLAAVLGASLQGSGFVAGCPIATIAHE
jgi:hypothetical protein